MRDGREDGLRNVVSPEIVYRQVRCTKLIQNLNDYGQKRGLGDIVGKKFCIYSKMDNSLPLAEAIKKRLVEMGVIASSEVSIVVTAITNPEAELNNLCAQWHFDEKIWE